MRAKSFLAGLLVPCLLMSTMPVRAEMIGTAQLLSQSAQREHASAFMARDDVKRQLETLGVDPAVAAQRVAGLTESELQALNGHIDSLPAGAGAVELVLIIILVLLVLELAGVIDIFKKI